MRKKTENKIKQLLQDSELSVKYARDRFSDFSNVLLGAIDCLMHQNAITMQTQDYLERQITMLESQSKKIEIEYYKLKNKMEE